MEPFVKLSVVLGVAFIGCASLIANSQGILSTTPHLQSIREQPDINTLHEILTQETDLRLELQKSVQFLLEDVASLKSDRDTLKLQVRTLIDENKFLKQQYSTLQNNFDSINNTCCTNGANNGGTNVSSALNNLSKKYRYATLSLLDLHARTHNLNYSILQSKEEQRKQRNDNDNMNRTLNSFKTSLLSTEHEQSKLVSSVFALETNISKQIKHEQSTLASSLSALETNLTKKIIASRSKISFSAGLTSSQTSFSAGATIKYNHLISNFGNGYDPSTGVFTSPADGTYVFFFSTYTYSSTYTIDLDIVCNGNTIVRGHAYDKYDYDAASNLVAIHLSEGDRVWVKHSGGYNAVESFDPPYSSTFSGFMI